MEPIKTEEKEPEKTKWQSFWELVRFALIALIVVVPIRLLIAEPFIVSGPSMVPTFENGDYLVVDKISYALGNPKRDDVVIFRYPNSPKTFFIKRVVGLPGETVNVSNNTVTIINKAHPDGFVLDQSFIKNNGGINGRLELKDDEYFVMGDNRGASSDSRSWGAVKKNLFVGKAFLRLLPINNIDILPGNYKQIESQ